MKYNAQFLSLDFLKIYRKIRIEWNLMYNLIMKELLKPRKQRYRNDLAKVKNLLEKLPMLVNT